MQKLCDSTAHFVVGGYEIVADVGGTVASISEGATRSVQLDLCRVGSGCVVWGVSVCGVREWVCGVRGHVMPGLYTCTCRQVVMLVCPGSNRVGMGWIHVHSVS